MMTLSQVITVMTSPFPNGQKFSCEWNCHYCPNEPGQPRYICIYLFLSYTLPYLEIIMYNNVIYVYTYVWYVYAL